MHIMKRHKPRAPGHSRSVVGVNRTRNGLIVKRFGLVRAGRTTSSNVDRFTVALRPAAVAPRQVPCSQSRTQSHNATFVGARHVSFASVATGKFACKCDGVSQMSNVTLAIG